MDRGQLLYQIDPAEFEAGKKAATAGAERAQATLIDATLEAADLRFRAVMMTALSFILGVLPLVFASGAGSASRQSVGTTVFGGM